MKRVVGECRIGWGVVKHMQADRSTGRDRYLEILAIHPTRQGNRLGPKLLDHHLAQIDSSMVQNAPAYLESSPPARRLYNSRGYEDVGDVSAEGWDDAFPAMYRPKMSQVEV